MSLASILASTDPSTIADCCIQNGSQAGSKVQLSQIKHRLNIFKAWLEISEVHRSQDDFDLESLLLSGVSLDVGCGQGDFIATAAALLLRDGKENGNKVIGIDPARLDYGAPFTLRQAQEHLSSSRLSSRLEFHQSTLEDYLEANPNLSIGSYSTLFLVHSIYYLSSPSMLTSILASARRHGVRSLCLSEWALKTSLGPTSRPAGSSAIPHILAVLLQSISPLKEGNVRFAFTLEVIGECAREAGWKMVGERIITPGQDLNDGGWEVYAARDVAKKSAKEDDLSKRESIRAHSHALEASIPEGKVTNVRSMDVWCAVFKPSP